MCAFESSSSLPCSLYQSDFQSYNLKPAQQHNNPRSAHSNDIERSKYRPVQMDLGILQPFKPDRNVPFSLFHEKKCILQTNPHDPIPEIKLENKMFELKLEAQNKRPSVYLIPQISFDKIPPDIMYGEKGNTGLASSIYSSDWKKACEVVVNKSQSKAKDDPTKATFKTNDLIDKSLERTRFKADYTIPPMELGLAKYIPTWDKQNPIEFVDLTKLFWEKNKDIALCSFCDSRHLSNVLSDEEKTEFENCLKEDVLRTPFALHPAGYTGYVPRLAPGIEFRKKRFTKYDAFVTTLMTLQGVCNKNSI